MPDHPPSPPTDAGRATASGLAETIFEARMDPAGGCFEAPAGMPLLQAAERSGLKVPSSCRNGTCRACIAQLLSGEVTYRIDWPGLSAEEKKAGCILPCAAYPLSDVVWTRFQGN